MRPIQHSTVTLPNQTCIPVSFSGDVRLGSNLVLKDVLFVPQFKFNLISISSLTTTSRLIVDFFPEHFIIQEPNSKKMIGRGKKLEGLYVLDASNMNEGLLNKAYVNKVSVHVWHNRLGHLSDKRLDVLKNQLNYDISKSSEATPCYICPLAKQRKLSFVSHNNMSQFPFDLIHCDILGPYNVTAHFGHRYFLTLVDDCTRFTWVFLLKQKSKVTTIIPNFFNMIATQFDKKIKEFRSDNAKELAFNDFFNDKGVMHHFSCVDRPQQNFVMERKHQHLLNVAGALYFQSPIPIQFWTECVLTAAFLVNRTPFLLLHNKTPYELLYKKNVDYSSSECLDVLLLLQLFLLIAQSFIFELGFAFVTTRLAQAVTIHTYITYLFT